MIFGVFSELCEKLTQFMKWGEIWVGWVGMWWRWVEMGKLNF